MYCELVSKVTLHCSSCDTTICFNIHSGDDEIQSLYAACDNLQCPKCKNFMENNSRDMLEKIIAYNLAASQMIRMAKATESELD